MGHAWHVDAEIGRSRRPLCLRLDRGRECNRAVGPAVYRRLQPVWEVRPTGAGRGRRFARRGVGRGRPSVGTPRPSRGPNRRAAGGEWRRHPVRWPHLARLGQPHGLGGAGRAPAPICVGRHAGAHSRPAQSRLAVHLPRRAATSGNRRRGHSRSRRQPGRSNASVGARKIRSDPRVVRSQPPNRARCGTRQGLAALPDVPRSDRGVGPDVMPRRGAQARACAAPTPCTSGRRAADRPRRNSGIADRRRNRVRGCPGGARYGRRFRFLPGWSASHDPQSLGRSGALPHVPLEPGRGRAERRPPRNAPPSSPAAGRGERRSRFRCPPHLRGADPMAAQAPLPCDAA